MVLDENAGIDQAKTIKKIDIEEEKKIFGLEEEKINEEKIEKIAEVDPITVTKTIDCGNNNDIYEGQVQTYIITIKNNTEQEIKNIEVLDQIYWK